MSVPNDDTLLTFVTHEQTMACFDCGLAGTTPEAAFPQESGLWDRPCPRCGGSRVWVTEPRLREEAS